MFFLQCLFKVSSMSELICRFEIMIFAIFFLIGSKSDLNLDLIIEEGSLTRGLPL